MTGMDADFLEQVVEKIQLKKKPQTTSISNKNILS